MSVVRAWGFDFSRYWPTDLDQVVEEQRPGTGTELHHALPLRLSATLTGYPTRCDAGLLKSMMVEADIAKEQVDALPVTGCIAVRSAKGATQLLYIQDPVGARLAREVPLDSPVTLFAIHVFTAADGPGLLVNEFTPGKAADPVPLLSPRQTPPARPQLVCSCGTPTFHPGTDLAATASGLSVPAADDGVIVKIEDDENAVVETRTTGRCGRYVVIKHAYPNGLSVYTRYAQLGRVAGADGKPLSVGMRVKRHDTIGEMGSSRTFHFEVRPVEPTMIDKAAALQFRGDPSMEWASMQPVEALGFDFDYFGSKDAAVK